MLLCALLVQVLVHPYIRREENHLEFASLTVLLVTVFAAASIGEGGRSAREDAISGLSSVARGSELFLSVLVVIFNFAVVAACAWAIFRDTRRVGTAKDEEEEGGQQSAEMQEAGAGAGHLLHGKVFDDPFTLR